MLLAVGYIVVNPPRSTNMLITRVMFLQGVEAFSLLFFLFILAALLIIGVKTVRVVPQPVITRDNVTIHVDSVVYWQITEPVKAVYEINDLIGGIVQLTITGMRAVMGDMDLDHTLSSRDQINAKLRIILDEATDKWGVKVTRVDVKNITPPEDVRITMEKQMTAERNRRALILTAEGDKQAAITRAEGEKQAAITRSEGNKQSAILDAEGAAQARLRTPYRLQ